MKACTFLRIPNGVGLGVSPNATEYGGGPNATEYGGGVAASLFLG